MKIAIIVARGGSKRVPRKNLRQFLGKPMLAWPIETACRSGLFEQVVISTEDEEIAEIACRYGACQPFIRPAALADDYSTTSDVLKHAITTLAGKGWNIEQCCALYGTSYGITPEWLKKGFDLLQNPTVDLTLAVKKYTHPYQRSLIIRPDGEAVYQFPENVNMRTQDFPPAYHDIGLFYWLKTSPFLQQGGKSFNPLRKRVVQIPELECIDIDSEDDLALAQALAQIRQNRLLDQNVAS